MTEKQLHILQAAKTLFATKGYDLTTTKNIAQEAGVNEVTIFRSFGSKEKLLTKVLEDQLFQPNFSAQLQDISGQSLEDQLQNIALGLKEMYQKNQDFIMINLRNSTGNKDFLSLIKQFPIKIYIHIKNLFESHLSLEKKEAEQRASLFLMSLLGINLNYNLLQILPGHDSYEHMTNQLIQKFICE